jgi:hypothetical protein
MFEKIVLAVALACSLYLNIQFKPPQKIVEVYPMIFQVMTMCPMNSVSKRSSAVSVDKER